VRDRRRATVAVIRVVRYGSRTAPTPRVYLGPKATFTVAVRRQSDVILPPANPGLFGGHDVAELFALATDYGFIAVELLVLYVVYGWLGRVLGFDGLL
jgi:hypothetical protein